MLRSSSPSRTRSFEMDRALAIDGAYDRRTRKAIKGCGAIDVEKVVN
jgi:hypothetical protein